VVWRSRAVLWLLVGDWQRWGSRRLVTRSSARALDRSAPTSAASSRLPRRRRRLRRDAAGPWTGRHRLSRPTSAASLRYRPQLRPRTACLRLDRFRLRRAPSCRRAPPTRGRVRARRFLHRGMRRAPNTALDETADSVLYKVHACVVASHLPLFVLCRPSSCWYVWALS